MCADTPEYKDTLNLPETDFPMRAGLPKREPEWLARWERIGVYDRLREKEGRVPFVLHDGPPYANGHLQYIAPSSGSSAQPLSSSCAASISTVGHTDSPC